MSHDSPSRRRTRAAKEIANIDATQEALAERWGVTVRTLQRWLTGDTSPRQADRERVCLAGGPRPEAWDELLPLPDSAPPPPRGVTSAEPASRDGTRSAADRLHAIALEELAALEQPGEGEETGKRLQHIERLAGVIVKLGDLTGAAVIDEKRIVASPAWQRLTEAFTDALRPWPEALAAVAEALEASK